ncbi:MAG: hypothetical protein KatS3mg113_1082 [Planctomycetaceae bacterium]|nr:MAG: hypothetical protein KatS3mg113_1082 [Planctomycetaceae bacterium]
MLRKLQNSRWQLLCWAVGVVLAQPIGLSADQPGVVRVASPRAIATPSTATVQTSDSGDCPYCAHSHGVGCLLCAKFSEHYCTNAADFGFSVPGKYPIHRRSVAFTHYFTPVGEGHRISAAPQVYHPTDTAQLGYYAQHVPFWLPQPNPLPARPIPAQWHHYAPAVYASEYHAYNGYYYGWQSHAPAAGSPSPIPENPQPQAPPPPAPESGPSTASRR